MQQPFPQSNPGSIGFYPQLDPGQIFLRPPSGFTLPSSGILRNSTRWFTL
jgi:hypothetical protein